MKFGSFLVIASALGLSVFTAPTSQNFAKRSVAGETQVNKRFFGPILRTVGSMFMGSKQGAKAPVKSIAKATAKPVAKTAAKPAVKPVAGNSKAPKVPSKAGPKKK